MDKKGCVIVLVGLVALSAILVVTGGWLFVRWARDEDGSNKADGERSYQAGRQLGERAPKTCVERVRRLVFDCGVLDLKCTLSAKKFHEGCLDVAGVPMGYCDGLPNTSGKRQQEWMEAQCEDPLQRAKCFPFKLMRLDYCESLGSASERQSR